MTTKQKIISILEKYSTTKELQSGENVNIIDEDDFDVISMEIESIIKELLLPYKIGNPDLSIKPICTCEYNGRYKEGDSNNCFNCGKIST
jgi:hypothetical protein